MKNMKIKSIAMAAIAAGVLMTTGTSFAGQWQNHHPRRYQVNERFRDQNQRITAGVKDGQLTHAEAHHLRREDRGILRQERSYAHYDDSHISRAEQQSLNHQENGVSRQIYNERHDGGQ